MAGVGEEEVGEYESDPEEAKLSLKMRRREASDDEDEGEGRSDEGMERREKLARRIESDGESEGAPAEYEDEEEIEELEGEEQEEYLEEEEEFEEEGEYEYQEIGGEGQGGREVDDAGAVEGERGQEGGGDRVGVGVMEANERDINGVNEKVDDNYTDNQQQKEEEKKGNEPYAVPTTGAFYMHDDRFRDNAGGRNRRTLGGRKLWESKDDRKWGHDKFEELTMHERQYEEGRRSSRDHSRGWARGRAALQGYPRGNRPKTYGNKSNQLNNNNHNDAPKIVRGRGPRRYLPSFKNKNDAPPAQHKQSTKPFEKPSHTNSGRATALVPNGESGKSPAKKQFFASSLNYASPPFYPSSSSSRDMNRDVQSETTNRNLQHSVLMAQSNTILRGKNIVDSIGMEKLYIDESTSGVDGKPSATLHFPPSGSSSMNSPQARHFRGQRRELNSLPLTSFQPSATNKLVSRVSPPTPLHAVQRNSVQSRVQPPVQPSGMQFAQRPGSISEPSSPPKAVAPVNILESGELESPELSKSKNVLVGKGKGNVQGSGRGSFLYGGAQVMGPSGNMGPGHGDQNIPGAPTFLPVMQFGGQHAGGIGVPAVGMAFPGYVGQPQLGLGNSEMTWLPVLAGAAGALGSSYPYFALDGTYHARPSGQTSASTAAPSNDNSTKPGIESKSSQKPELVNDDFGQRQKNPRRYTEMKFDQ